MRYVSICSGIDAPTVAWSPLGWRPIAFAEIAKFPSAVLAHHYPEVPNLGDFTKIESIDGATDILVGGTPCQKYSVAGSRKGMGVGGDELALKFLQLAGRLRPRWIVWENVPGFLSSRRGRDFGSFLGTMAELGYGWSYRILDAQYCRVDGFGRAIPQRRRRVFVVGHLGDWRRAAAALFDRESLSGHPSPGRETTSSVAAFASNGVGTRGADDNQGRPGHLIAPDVSLCFNAGGMKRQDHETETLVAYQCHGTNVGEMGTLRSGNGNVTGGVPFIPRLFGFRRLTPVECERLMGFPDRWTDILFRGKPAKDGPRYKSLGNSMAVNVIRWLGRRIELAESIIGA